MFASLDMYDLPELRTATDAWWHGISSALRRAGIEVVPDALTRDGDSRHWPEMLLGQTCGYPLTHELAGVVELVATPAYSADGCSGVDYRSLLVVSEENSAETLDDLRGGVCAYNSRNSQSGYNALRAAVAPLARGGRFFSRVVESGSHPASIELVANGKADVCAVDCVTHGLLARCRPHALAGTRIIGVTDSAPGLPYVTRAGAGSDRIKRLRDGLSEAFADPHLAEIREALLLTGMQVLGYEAYGCIGAMEDAARAVGYAEIN